MKIAAYVQDKYAKSTYKNECMDVRQFVGLRVIIDALQRNGYSVDWAGRATVHRYDIVLVSITSDCDWWEFVKERMTWQKGSYKVIVGGAGVLHITPFLPFADYFSLGRGEESVVELVKALDGKASKVDDSIIESASFSPDRIYHIRQGQPYQFPVALGNKEYTEAEIGCNHKCLFCGYTWQRKFCGESKTYRMDGGLFGGMGDKERALLDMYNGDPVDLNKLRTTAIDGMSERLRYMVNKRISKEMLVDFLRKCVTSDAKPHQLKLFNIIGYPTETEDDWREFAETLALADVGAAEGKQWCFLLNCTPFRPMPATPLACAPAEKRNLRGAVSRTLGKDLKGNIIFQGKSLWSVEGMGTDSISTVMLSMLAHRGGENDTENIMKLCRTNKFWSASGAVKEATLEKYFDMDYLFGEFTPETLPSRYLRTYAKVEKMWERPAWKEPWVIKNGQ